MNLEHEKLIRPVLEESYNYFLQLQEANEKIILLENENFDLQNGLSFVESENEKLQEKINELNGLLEEFSMRYSHRLYSNDY